MKATKDWADEAAERFYLTHTKCCQGPNATTETVGKWISALAQKFRALKGAQPAGKRGKR